MHHICKLFSRNYEGGDIAALPSLLPDLFQLFRLEQLLGFLLGHPRRPLHGLDCCLQGTGHFNLVVSQQQVDVQLGSVEVGTDVLLQTSRHGKLTSGIVSRLDGFSDHKLLSLP